MAGTPRKQGGKAAKSATNPRKKTTAAELKKKMGSGKPSKRRMY